MRNNFLLGKNSLTTENNQLLGLFYMQIEHTHIHTRVAVKAKSKFNCFAGKRKLKTVICGCPSC